MKAHSIMPRPNWHTAFRKWSKHAGGPVLRHHSLKAAGEFADVMQSNEETKRPGRNEGRMVAWEKRGHRSDIKAMRDQRMRFVQTAGLRLRLAPKQLAFR
jgi:hypothetical protein